MKKISIMIMVLVVALASCKKTPEVNLKYVDVERDLVTVGTTTANIQCDYEYIATLKKAYLFYGEGENEDAFTSAEMRVVQNTLYVELTDLKENTTYSYYYEFHNGFNSMRSASKTFKMETSPTSLATVITAEVTEITINSAKGGGEVTNDGGAEVTERGICWSTTADPTISDSHVAAGTGTGAFTATMSGLEAHTTYHVRAYATNEKGTAYGLDREFTTNRTEGALTGDFSVSETEKVRFSKGNLQYQASTNTWRFAENQWDYVGDNTLGTVYENGVKCDNSLISSTYDGWIDLFCWGTGNEPTHVSPRPWDVFVDWGINPISNGGNCPNQWLTMSLEELQYLFGSRNTPSGIRFAKAVVNDINGIVLLPDDWQESYYTLNNPNSSNSSYASNTISLDDWASLESYGAVFFPAAGMRYGQIYGSGSGGQYWSCTDMNFDNRGHTMSFSDEGFSIGEGLAFYKDFGQSVRLVQFVQTPSFNINATPNQEGYGSVDGGGVYELGQTCTLTAIPNEGYIFVNWKLDGVVVSTENTYSFVVRNNKNYVATFCESTTYPFTYSYYDSDHIATLTGRVDGVELEGELVIPGTVMHNGEVYTLTAIGKMAFFSCHNLTSVEFPSSLESISDFAFGECNGITDVFIPSSVTHLGKNPFTKCSNLSQITVESGNTYYDSRDDCHAIIETATNKLVSGSLTSIIPNTVTSIGEEAFWGILVPSITIPALVNYIGANAIRIYTLSSMTVLAEVPPTLDGCTFCDTDHSIPVYVPCGSIEAYQNAYGWNEFTNFIEMP